MNLPNDMDFHDEKYGVVKPDEGFPPPVDDLTQTLVNDLFEHERQRASLDDTIKRLKDSNEAFRKRCHHYERQIETYEKVINFMEARYDNRY